MAGHEKVSYSVRPDTARRVRELAKRQGEKLSVVADALLVDALDQAEVVAAATTNPVVMAAVARAMSEPGVLRSMLDVMRADLTEDQLRLFTSPVVAPPRERTAAAARPGRTGKKRNSGRVSGR